ncbi:hypothetical protein [Streptomyces sp. NPDC001492]
MRERVDHTPTAPLPAPAVEALASLPLEIRKAVVRYQNASATTAELCAITDYRSLTVAEFDELEFAQDTVLESLAILEAAGRLDLIEVAS